MKKENLILIHSFPTNSIIFKELIDYLNKYCKVYFIDLPGFTRKNKRLNDITTENYVKYAENKIKSFRLKHYVLGGISFGFYIINKIKIDKKCRGILGIEPYFNSQSLNMNYFKKEIYKRIINIILALRLQKILEKMLVQVYSKNNREIVAKEIEPTTFFKTAKLILNIDEEPEFNDVPYVLLINKKDGTLKPEYIERIFEHDIKKLLVIHETIEHYPKDLSKNYFIKKLPEKTVKRIVNFLKKSN